MLIDQDKWNEIIKVTETQIAAWNESAQKKGKKDRFTVRVQDEGKYSLLITHHIGEGYRGNEAKGVVREIATGELRPTKINRRNGRLTGFTVKMSDPKAWKSLADKPADVIVDKLGLVNYVMYLGVTMTDVSVVGPRDAGPL